MPGFPRGPAFPIVCALALVVAGCSAGFGDDLTGGPGEGAGIAGGGGESAGEAGAAGQTSGGTGGLAGGGASAGKAGAGGVAGAAGTSGAGFAGTSGKGGSAGTSGNAGAGGTTTGGGGAGGASSGVSGTSGAAGIAGGAAGGSTGGSTNVGGSAGATGGGGGTGGAGAMGGAAGKASSGGSSSGKGGSASGAAGSSSGAGGAGGVVPQPICGNGVVETGEQCDVGGGKNDRCDGCQIVCSGQSRSFGGHCYTFQQNQRSFDSALTSCAPGEHLVTISSEGENSFVGQLVKDKIGFIVEGAWIGLFDTVAEGTFVWVTGEPFGYTAWAQNEPNDFGNEDCGMIRRNGDWNDALCLKSYPYVCELDLGASASPSGPD